MENPKITTIVLQYDNAEEKALSTIQAGKCVFHVKSTFGRKPYKDILIEILKRNLMESE